MIETRGMSFDLPPELLTFQAELRRFVDDELIPIEGQSTDGHVLRADVRAHLENEARRRDLWLLHVSARDGGRERGLLSRAVMWEQLGRTTALLARGRAVFGPEPGAMLGEQLNDAQREAFLLPLLRGEKLTAFGQTEPNAGSDPARVATTALRDGDTYVVNGLKRFIGAGDEADFIQLIVATDPAKGARGGISALLVDMKSPGIRITRLIETVMRDRPAEIVFENVVVPVANRIGAEGDGFKLGQRWLTEGRIKHAARAIGVIERCLELAVARSTQRSTFGAPLSDRQFIQGMLAEMYLHAHQLRLMTYNAAWRYDRGEDIRNEAFMCKVFGDEKSFAAADRCIQIFGGLGLTTELPITTMWHDQRAMMITEGPSEVLTTALAQRVISQYRPAEKAAH
jgi:acyl-CoA dehydrogenase